SRHRKRQLNPMSKRRLKISRQLCGTWLIVCGFYTSHPNLTGSDKSRFHQHFSVSANASYEQLLVGMSGGATGEPHSSQNFATDETRWPFKHRLLSSTRWTCVAEYST